MTIAEARQRLIGASEESDVAYRFARIFESRGWVWCFSDGTRVPTADDIGTHIHRLIYDAAHDAQRDGQSWSWSAGRITVRFTRRADGWHGTVELEVAR